MTLIQDGKLTQKLAQWYADLCITRKEVNSRWQAILETGYTVCGTFLTLGLEEQGKAHMFLRTAQPTCNKGCSFYFIPQLVHVAGYAEYSSNGMVFCS